MSAKGAKSGGGLRLLSSWFCPFAQRAWIAAEEKGIEYEYVEVDPYAKPVELLRLNPRGLVPAVEYEGGGIYESMVVMEFIDEAFENSAPLMPEGAFERAQARIWMDFVNRKVVPTFYRLLQRQEKEEQQQEAAALLDAYKELMKAKKELSRGESPFFFGKQFTLLDICLAPWPLRHDVLHFYRGFELPEGEEFDAFKCWLKAVEDWPSVRVTLADPLKMREIYKRYADNTATSEVAKAINSNKALP